MNEGVFVVCLDTDVDADARVDAGAHVHARVPSNVLILKRLVDLEGLAKYLSTAPDVIAVETAYRAPSQMHNHRIAQHRSYVTDAHSQHGASVTNASGTRQLTSSSLARG